MRKPFNQHIDRDLLRAAIVGVQSKIDSESRRLAEYTKQLAELQVGHRPVVPGKQRRLSAAARKRISVASKKRWAEYRRKKAGK